MTTNTHLHGFHFSEIQISIKKHPRIDPKATATGTLDLEEHDSSIAFASVNCTNQN